MSNFVDLNKNNPDGYEPISNGLINDDSISVFARFLYIYMTSKPVGWDFFNQPICHALQCEERTLRKYVNELVEHGLLIKHKQSTENGKFGAIQYTLIPYGHNMSDTEKPSRIKCVTAKTSDLYNTDIYTVHTTIQTDKKRDNINARARDDFSPILSTEEDVRTNYDNLKNELLHSDIFRTANAKNFNVPLETVDAAIEDLIKYMETTEQPATLFIAKRLFPHNMKIYLREHPQTPVKERYKAFVQEVDKHKSEFGLSVRQPFFNYWTQQSKNFPDLMLFEEKDGFNVRARLKEWASRNNKQA